MAEHTFTRTHVYVTFANPYLTCDECDSWVAGWHDDARCDCSAGSWVMPCEHSAMAVSACPSWSPVDGCSCAAVLGHVQHFEPPAPAGNTPEDPA